jgi:hypothetical protein
MAGQAQSGARLDALNQAGRTECAAVLANRAFVLGHAQPSAEPVEFAGCPATFGTTSLARSAMVAGAADALGRGADPLQTSDDQRASFAQHLT